MEGLMLKLKLQYFHHLIQRTDLFEKTFMLGKIEGGRRREQQRMIRWDGITDSNGLEFEHLHAVLGYAAACRVERHPAQDLETLTTRPLAFLTRGSRLIGKVIK